MDHNHLCVMIWKNLQPCVAIACFVVGLANCSRGADRYGVQNVPVPTGAFASPSWSADGQFVVLQFNPKSASVRNNQIVMMNQDGSNFRMLIETVGYDLLISSPESWCNNKIGFQRSELLPYGSFPISSTLKSINFDGSNEQTVLDAVGEVTLAAWGSRKCRVAFETKDTSGLSHLMIFDPSSKLTQEVLVLPKNMWFEDIEWSRSGEKIAYTVVQKLSNRNDISHLEVLDINTNARQILTDDSIGITSNPTWSTDDKRLAFRVTNRDYQSQIALLSLDHPEKVFAVDTRGISPVELSWSPVANKLIVTSLNSLGKDSIYIIDLGSASELEQKVKASP